MMNEEMNRHGLELLLRSSFEVNLAPPPVVR
jgi:hypothetical protein